MRHRSFLYLYVLCLFGVNQTIYGQHIPHANIQDSIRSVEYIKVQHTDSRSWITRYQQEVDAHYEANKLLADTSCDVLFLGSSSINGWEGIEEDMSPMKIIRRSYGGAALRDMLYNYDVIARDFNPKSIVLYVENDINGSPDDVTMGAVFDYFRIFIARLQRDYPGIPVFLLSIKPSFARDYLRTKHEIINTLLREYASVTSGVMYLDVASPMYDNKGHLRKELFKSDNLHMNRKGYDIWRDILKPELMKVVYAK